MDPSLSWRGHGWAYRSQRPSRFERTYGTHRPVRSKWNFRSCWPDRTVRPVRRWSNRTVRPVRPVRRTVRADRSFRTEWPRWSRVDRRRRGRLDVHRCSSVRHHGQRRCEVLAGFVPHVHAVRRRTVRHDFNVRVRVGSSVDTHQPYDFRSVERSHHCELPHVPARTSGRNRSLWSVRSFWSDRSKRSVRTLWWSVRSRRAERAVRPCRTKRTVGTDRCSLNCQWAVRTCRGVRTQRSKRTLWRSKWTDRSRWTQRSKRSLWS